MPDAAGFRHGQDQQRRHRLAPRVGGPRDAHDAGPRVLLRRPGAPQERARDDHAQLLHPLPHLGPMGPLGLLARVRTGHQRDHRRARLGRPPRGRSGARPIRRDRPARGLHGLPDDVRRHHAGAHHRRVRRAQAVQGLRRLHAALGHARLRPGRALGLGRRLARQARCARLRGRHRRAHHERRLGARRRARPWQARRLRPRADGPARRDDDRPGRVAPLVRLVRTRALRASSARPRGRSPGSSRSHRRRGTSTYRRPSSSASAPARSATSGSRSPSACASTTRSTSSGCMAWVGPGARSRPACSRRSP